MLNYHNREQENKYNVGEELYKIINIKRVS